MIMDTAAAQSRAMYADLNTRDYGKIMSHYVAGEFISSENGMTYRNRAAIDSSGRAFWGALKTVAFTKVSDKVQVLDRDNFVLSSQWHMVAADSAGHNMDMTGAWVGTFHRTDAGFKVVAESNSMSG